MTIDEIIKLMAHHPELDFVKVCNQFWHPIEDILNMEKVGN